MIFDSRLKHEIAQEFDGFEKEYERVRSGAGLINLSFRGRLRVTGKDRSGFLQRLISIDVNGMKPGDCQTGCFLTGTAKIQCVLDVLMQENEILLDTHESQAAQVAALFEKFHFNEDVAFEDVSETYAEFALEGPKAPEAIKNFPIRPDLVIAEKSITGEKGFRIWIPSSGAQVLEKMSPIRVGFNAFDALRIEAQEPFFGIDIDENTLLPETGKLDWASTTKGCYAGQEVIQRVRNFGHPSRLLVKLLGEGRGALTGARILAERKEVGVVTSAAFSQRLKKSIGLGLIPFSLAQAGKNLEVQTTDGRRMDAVVQI